MDCLLQMIKINTFNYVVKGSKNFHVEIVAQLFNLAIYHFLLDCDVEVTRIEHHSVASKNHKIQWTSVINQIS